jgi:hypothetical protein
LELRGVFFGACQRRWRPAIDYEVGAFVYAHHKGVIGSKAWSTRDSNGRQHDDETNQLGAHRRVPKAG